MKRLWNDLKIISSAGFQYITGRWKWNLKGVDETSQRLLNSCMTLSVTKAVST